MIPSVDFIIEHLDRLPEIGDGVTTEDDIHLVVEKLDKNRIESVHLYLPEPNRKMKKETRINPRLLFILHLSLLLRQVSEYLRSHPR